jgi:signal peptidase I
MHYTSGFPIRIFLLPSLLGLLTLTVLFDVVRVEGRSMEPHIAAESNVLVWRAAFGIQLPVVNRYLVVWDNPSIHDIIVYTLPDEHRAVVKRVVGTGGDPYRIENSVVFLNDRRIRLDSSTEQEMAGRNTIPEGTVFVLGDNEMLSRDSRHYGVIPVWSIHGRVVFPSHR